MKIQILPRIEDGSLVGMNCLRGRAVQGVGKLNQDENSVHSFRQILIEN